MTIPANLILEKNKPNAQSAWVVLLDVTLTNGTVLRYARAHADLVFGRGLYTGNNVAGHWKLNDNLPDTVVTDSGPNGNTGTLVGGANTEDNTIAGKINAAQQFDGAVDYVDTNDPFQSTFRDSFSVSLWVKPDDGQPASLEYYWGVADTTGANSQMYLILDTDGTLRIQYLSEGGTPVDLSSTTALADGAASEWTHAVLTMTPSGTGADTALYVNSVLEASGTASNVNMSSFSSTRHPYIGGRNVDGVLFGPFAGGIDNVMLFNKALTQAEIDVLYNAGNGTELVPTTYTAIGFGLDATKLNNTGEIPTLDLNVHDVGLVLRPQLRTLNGAIGSTVKIIVANTSYLAEDLTELELEFEVLSTRSNANNVTFRLGAPQRLFQRFPMERDFALFCQFRYRTSSGRITPECGYTAKNVVGYTLPSGTPVNIEATTHGFATGDSIRLDDVDDPTPSLDGIYTITVVDPDNFTLDGTDGDDFSGAFVSGGTAGYDECPRSLTDCQDRENSVRFGAAPGLEEGGLRIA